MGPLHLDERLQTAADLFPACAYGADIGADHGRLSCYLLEKEICQRMCVADISEPSLEKARELLTVRGLSQRADFRVGDGLTVLPAAAQAVAILGMGAGTIGEILKKGEDRLHGAALILSAHTQIHLMRRTLARLHYRIEEERIAFAAGRHYVVLRAIPGEEAYTEKQLWLGPRLMESCVSHYPGYLSYQMAVTAPKRTEEARQYLQWLKEEQERVRDGWDH